MTGMKEGAGEDPFADDAKENRPTTDATTETTMSDTTTDTADEATSDTTAKTVPWVLARDGVSDGRKMVPFELRPEYRGLDEDVLQDIAEILGTDATDQYITDVREAMVAVAARHPEEVAEEMREWGCEHL